MGKYTAIVETVLTAPLAKEWAFIFNRVGGAGFSMWFLSGYPVTSLPMYMTLAGAVSFRITGCCFDDSAAPGVAQCYKPVKAELDDVVHKTANNTIKLVGDMSKKPKKYFGFT